MKGSFVLPILLGMALVSCLDTAKGAETSQLSIERRTPQVQIDAPRRQGPATFATDEQDVDPPDTMAFWVYIRRGDVVPAEAELRRLRQRDPNWVPTSDMIAALESLRAKPPVPAVTPVQNPSVVRVPVRRPQEPDFVAQGWEAYNTKDYDAAVALFTQAGEKGQAPYGLALAFRAKGNLANAEKLACFPKKKSSATSTLCRELLTERVLDSAKQRDWRQTLYVLDKLARHGGVPEELRVLEGWAAFEDGRFSRAISAFSEAPASPNARFGLALAVLRSGNEAGALAISCPAATLSKELKGVCLDILADHAGKAATAERWDDVVRSVDRAAVYGGGFDTLPESMRSLGGWAALKTGNAKRAYETFLELYPHHRDPDIGMGLALAARDFGAMASVQVWAREDPILADVVAILEGRKM